MLTEKTKNSNIKKALATGAIIALLPILAHAEQGTFITEPFSCEVALADYHHLTSTTKEDNPKFMQEQLEISLKAVTQELAEHAECKGVSDGK